TVPAVTGVYCAEGFSPFAEIGSLVMPNENGTVVIDYYKASQHGQSYAFLTQGSVEPVDVSSTIGPNQPVSMKVTLPGPGIAERTVHFTFASRCGSTDTVESKQPASQGELHKVSP